ncbi:AmmeMemoRadiSam system protein A [Sulfurimonas sp.]|uniref:AmmeMemoRadiSam system protein A n=1 Tax=Sulfurimonas sp. TaxID=2022749 RepID=UPI0025E0E8A2|nr:AmmeMemoRadiSam system protein A [Sulfurimonas sp.]MDD5157410.1 AmmeMemoRadiSam system protein A [Sulfurimonas sp.]
MLDAIVLRVAKSAIMGEFDDSYNFDSDSVLKDYPFLSENGAAFVTLKYDNSLRGCIGSVVAHRRLFDDIIYNALSAAFSDPRFRPLSADELSHIGLEVSVLSNPEVLEYDNFYDLVKKVTPKVDGLILKHGVHQGTFLPQVWEQLPTPELFLEHLSLKAGANPSIYAEHPTIYRYRVNAIEKNFDEILSL